MTQYRLTTEKTWDETIRDLEETFRKWRVRDWHVEPMRPPRKANQHHGEAERNVTLRYTCCGRRREPSGSLCALLGVQRGDPLDLIEAIYRARIRAAHPDRGGSDETAARLNGAIAQIREELML